MEVGNIIIGLSLIIVSGAAKGVMDIIQHKFKASIFSDEEIYNPNFWNPKKSWTNKWKVKYGKLQEKFPGSSTVFVFVTDAWHFFQFITYNLLAIGYFFLTRGDDDSIISIIYVVLGLAIHKMVFEMFYKYVLKK